MQARNLDWSSIHSVFLDMDGTLLDLNYDNHFWREYVPSRYAEKHRLDPQQAKEALFQRYQAVEGTMDWYCIDYWSRELGMDIGLLKHEVAHLIAVHPHVEAFLQAVHRLDKRLVLVTNAHGKSLSLKMRRTRLGRYFDAIICSHDFGLPKEAPAFWQRLQAREWFDPEATLLVDDSESVLRSARGYGIAHLLAVYRPDSLGPLRQISEFDAIHSFAEITPPSA